MSVVKCPLSGVICSLVQREKREMREKKEEERINEGKT